MLFVLLYVGLSLVFYAKMFQAMKAKHQGFNTRNPHPEAREVKRGESLLVVRFDDSPTTPDNSQSGDLGFSLFLANNPPDDRNNDGA